MVLHEVHYSYVAQWSWCSINREFTSGSVMGVTRANLSEFPDLRAGLQSR